jgi:hypothetical protein
MQNASHHTLSKMLPALCFAQEQLHARLLDEAVRLQAIPGLNLPPPLGSLSRGMLQAVEAAQRRLHWTEYGRAADGLLKHSRKLVLRARVLGRDGQKRRCSIRARAMAMALRRSSQAIFGIYVECLYFYNRGFGWVEPTTPLPQMPNTGEEKLPLGKNVVEKILSLILGQHFSWQF